ncbi:MAG: dCTP deaminase [Neptuniibacter sp.]
MALSDIDLKKQRQKRFVIEPWKKEQCSPLGYDQRMGFIIDPESAEELYPKDFNKNEIVDITIKAHKSVVVVTQERIYLTGSVIGTVHARSGISAKGVLVNSVTVDPHWNGRLILTFCNSSNQDITIQSDKGMATLILHSVETETDHSGHKSETKQLLQDRSRYSSDVSTKILTYLNEYESTDGERRYQFARKETKKYREKNPLERKLVALKNETEWYEIVKTFSLYSLILFVILLLIVMFIPDVSTIPVLNSIDKNSEPLSVIIAIAALLLSIFSKLDTNGKEEET